MTPAAGFSPAIERRRGLRGFTLLEMLVVIAILGLIGGLVFPAVERQIVGASFRASALELVLSVRHAQADALRENRTVRVQNPVGLQKASIVTEESPPILFFRDGTSNGGTKALRSGARIFRVIVNPQTGVVTSAFQ